MLVKYSAWTLFLLQSVLIVKVLSQGDFNLEDALDDHLPTPPPGTTKAPSKIQPKVPPKPKPGGISDDDLAGVAGDNTYKPDKGKGNQPGYGNTDQRDGDIATTAEVGTIGGIVSAVAVALVGAITSYISYQKKKLCFGIQQSLNVDMMKSENPEAVVSTEPQAQQTLLEPPNSNPPRNEENPV